MVNTKNYRNYAQTSNIQIVTRLFEDEDVTYYIQSLNIPSIATNIIQLNTQFGQLQVLNDVNTYEHLDLKLIIDEDLEVYKALLKYCQKRHKPGTMYNAEPEYKDIYLIIYNNNNKELLKLVFKNCYLDSIGALDYAFNDDNSEVVTSAIIKYNYFELIE